MHGALSGGLFVCGKVDTRNSHSLLARERRQLRCLSVGAFPSPTDTKIPLTHH